MRLPVGVALCCCLASGASWGHMYSLGDPAVTMYQAMTQVDATTWQYAFSFTNTTSQNIWALGVYETQAIDTGSMSTLPHWSRNATNDLPNLPDPYQPQHNVDPALTAGVFTAVEDYAVGWQYGNSAYAIKPGETFSSLSFTASWADLSPKFFYYEAGTNYANKSGSVNYYGYTQAAPGLPAFALLGAAPLVGGIVRRFRRK